MISDSTFFTILKNRLVDEGLPEDRVIWFLRDKKKVLIPDIISYYKDWEKEKYSSLGDSEQSMDSVIQEDTGPNQQSY